jgi:hypothetical protein
VGFAHRTYGAHLALPVQWRSETTRKDLCFRSSYVPEVLHTTTISGRISAVPEHFPIVLSSTAPPSKAITALESAPASCVRGWSGRTGPWMQAFCTRCGSRTHCVAVASPNAGNCQSGEQTSAICSSGLVDWSPQCTCPWEYMHEATPSSWH